MNMLLHPDREKVQQYLGFLGLPASVAAVYPGPKFTLLANNALHAEFFGIPVLDEETPITLESLESLLTRGEPGRSGDYLDRLQRNYARVIDTGSPLNTEGEYTDGNGDVRWSQNHLIPLFQHGKVARIFVTMSDVTEVYRINRQLEESLSSLLQSIDLEVCESCHQIHGPDGNWESLSTFMQRDSSLVFSHGVCEACSEKYFGDLIE